MKRPYCTRCLAHVRCCTHGANTARQLRETIKKLRVVLAVVTKCEMRKRWDASLKVGSR